MIRRAAGGLAWVGALVATLALLQALGSGSLAPPPVRDGAALQRWLAQRDAVTAAFALVRVAGLVLAAYLLAVTALGLAARASRVPALVAAADVVTVPVVRRVLGAVAGVGLTASTAGLLTADSPPRPPAAQVVDPADASVVLERLPDRSDVVLRWQPAPAGDDGPSPGGTATMRVDGGAPPPAGQEWRVEAGQSFWEVAERSLARAWGRAPTDDEVAPYWAALVEANRSRLVDPADPDLVRPGQVFTLLPAPAPPPP
ncbi:MAG TPA: hypothetical protein VEW93_08940 [Acidimicrobiales bacterium]|nr:hypothetical protein [Acidimicrobiales bacterium]